jgi:hypothetical protein
MNLQTHGLMSPLLPLHARICHPSWITWTLELAVSIPRMGVDDHVEY